ncbi:ABC transporter permease [Natrialbaceae archaeon AArc-T1-2]|uniref:ABC transporter permease n=1 Tax=Natrialbaceae archaeon AArc-T1-2 TaxID=3053904 RepID=UPI00255A81C3|nr:ABC transporter permease [Natrialbaceae archaeon AArc-T1-2]WIV66748.1 ABC transporter permease [Natrialbaceae archaeon AArc-T1-2]
MVDEDTDTTWRARWYGVVSMSLSRVREQATRVMPGRIASTVLAVALTIGLLLLVTGVAVALADDGITSETDADVRIAPADGGSLSALDGVESPRLGEASERSETIRSTDGVDHATPMLVETVALQTSDGESERVLAVGVVPDADASVATLPAASLEDGAEDEPSGPIVLSDAAADRLAVTSGDDLEVAETETNDASLSLAVTAVESGDGDVPVALVHLDDLQELSGADEGDLADGVLVWGENDRAVSAAESAYPDATIETDDEVTLAALFDDGLALATSLIALVVGVTVCSLFVATTAGLTVEEDRETLAVLAAVGFPVRSRLATVAVTTLSTTLGGAIVGIAVGFGGIVVVNALADAVMASGAVAHAHPLFAPYAVAVAVFSGLAALPYPLAIAARTDVLAEVGR